MANIDLSIIIQSSLRKRIKRDLELLINDNYLHEDSLISIEINTDKRLMDRQSYKIEFCNYKDYRTYELIVPRDYPFYPPKLKINYKPYSEYHNIDAIEFRQALLKFKGIRCFCCETILCGNNWGPQFTFKKILEEVEYFREAVREISYRVIIDVIKRKYLINDINIIEWLYLNTK